MNKANYQWQSFDPFSDKLPYEGRSEKRSKNREDVKKSKERKAATKGKAGNIFKDIL